MIAKEGAASVDNEGTSATRVRGLPVVIEEEDTPAGAELEESGAVLEEFIGECARALIDSRNYD